jgi:endonuclease III
MTSREIEQKKLLWAKIGPVLLKRYRRDETFLDYANPWQLSVAVTLSAQTTDEAVNKVTPLLFKTFPTPDSLARAPISKIEKIIGSLGFFRSKAKYIKSAADVVVKEFQRCHSTRSRPYPTHAGHRTQRRDRGHLKRVSQVCKHRHSGRHPCHTICKTIWS